MTKKAKEKKSLLKIYRNMFLIRRFEEKAGQAYGMEQIGGFCHLYIGQEAVVVGMQSVITAEDYTITSYRSHGHALAAGTDPKFVMAELFGKETGSSKGKGGSMHLFDVENKFFGGHGIVGAQTSLGTGIGFACKYKKSPGICLTYLGDGAINQGQLYESLNMAALWKLPVLYIIENNGYAMGTSVERSCAMTQLYKKGESFGIKGEAVDGMDVLAVQEAGRMAIEYVRAGNGPLMLEMKTYRYRGHSMSDPAKYRTKEEVEEYKSKRDPIMVMQNYLLTNKIATEEELKGVEKEIREQIDEAVSFAKNSAQPSEDELYKDIYC